MPTYLSDLLRDVQQGGGIFSPLAMRSTKRLARAVAPRVPAAAAAYAGDVERAEASKFGAVTQARGRVQETAMGEAGALERAGVAEEGKTFRTRLAIAGDKATQQMITRRELAKRSLMEEGETERTKMKGDLAKYLAAEEDYAFQRGLSQARNLLNEATGQGGYVYSPETAVPTRKKRRPLQSGDTVTMPGGEQRYLKFE